MKKLALIICVVFSSLISKSQSYDSLVVDDARWVVRQWSAPNYFYFQDGYEYYFNGDTVVGGFNYKKVFAHEVMPDTIHPGFLYEVQPPFLFGIVREDILAKKVYIIQFTNSFWGSMLCNTGSEELLYDFNLNIGDTMNATYSCNYFVTGWNSIVTSIGIQNTTWGGNRKVFDFSGSESIIEGIGGVNGPFQGIEALPNSFFTQVELYSYCRGTAYNCGTLITSNQELENNPVIKISPNPVTDILQISDASNIKSISIYNSTSQLVKTISKDNFKNIKSVSIDVSQLQNGFYFVSIITATNIFNAKIVKQ